MKPKKKKMSNSKKTVNSEKNSNTKIIVTIELIVIFIIIIALIIGIKEYNLSKAKINKKFAEESIKEASEEITEKTEIELESEFELNNNLYVVDITETEENNTKNETKNNEQNKNIVSNAKYYIKVNYGAQVVTIYSKDLEGNYTVPVKSMICSTGPATPKAGVYAIPGRWSWGLMQGNVYGHYVTKITGNILFHSVPYTQQNPSTLEYWEYDKLGTPASLGCVRLKVEDAKWIYNNCENGTNVEFYSNEDAGPLGKPTAKKISDYPDYLRNWDPTDSNPSNPWHSYKESDQQIENNNKTNIQEKNETTNIQINVTKNETQNKEQNVVKTKVENQEQNKTHNEIEVQKQNKVENKMKNMLH